MPSRILTLILQGFHHNSECTFVFCLQFFQQVWHLRIFKFFLHSCHFGNCVLPVTFFLFYLFYLVLELYTIGVGFQNGIFRNLYFFLKDIYLCCNSYDFLLCIVLNLLTYVGLQGQSLFFCDQLLQFSTANLYLFLQIIKVLFLRFQLTLSSLQFVQFFLKPLQFSELALLKRLTLLKNLIS